MELSNIKTPKQFIEFMELIWGDTCEPTDEGLVLHFHPQYDEYHNANKVARLIGIHRTGGTKINDKWGSTYRWPNGEGVRISYDGDACAIAIRFSPKIKKRTDNSHP